MLLLVLVWIMLLIPMLIAGTRLMLAVTPMQPPPRDSAFIAVWLGLLAIANILLAVALAGPVTVLDLALVLLASCAAGIVHGPTRAQTREYLRRWFAHGGAAIPCVIVSVAAAATAAMPVSLYDTGLYHYPQLSWLAAHGDSPGLALLHFRFAFVTSWLTIPASLDHGLLAGRTSALLNGFVLMLVMAQLVVALTRWRLGTSDGADRFWVCAAGGAAAYAVAAGFVNSASPDLPVFFLPALILATTLRSKPGDLPGPIFLLALLMFTIKLSTLPAVAVTGAYAAWRVPPRSLIKWAAVAAVVGVPMAVTGIVVSGCVLFPIDSTCFDVSWALPPHTAAATAKVTTEWARWNGSKPLQADIATWWMHWGARKSNLVLILLLALSIAAGLALGRQMKKDVPVAFSILLAISGIGYVIVLAPDLRFAIGYLVILPALFIARLDLNAVVLRRRVGMIVSGAVILVLGPALVILVANAAQALASQGLPRRALFSGLVQPPRIIWFRRLGQGGDDPDPAFYVQVDNGHFLYRHPVDGDQCWDIPLPCSPGPLPGDIALKRPERGVGGGFVRR